MYDAVIIGAGPAGLSAAIYTCRKDMKTLVVAANVGGQMTMTSHIENYPGVEPQSGIKLIGKMQENAVSFGAEFKMAKVEKVAKGDKNFVIKLSDGEILETRGVILAFGKEPRTLGIPGEDEFFGKGVSTCATCDAPFYRDKIVVVIGGGNSAVEAAIDLAKIVKEVHIVHRRDEYRADEVNVKDMRSLGNVREHLSSEAVEVLGDKFVEGVKIKNKKTGEESVLDAEGMFLEIGFELKTDMVENLIDRNERGEIKINKKNETNVNGITAAGDVTEVPYKQAIIAAGEGAKAALSLYSQLKGKSAVVDWEK